MFEGIKRKMKDFKEWFLKKGDDMFGVDRTIEELELDGFIPKHVHEKIENLKDEENKAENDFIDLRKDYEEAVIEKKNCDSRLKQKENILNNEYGLFSKFLHNFIPIPFAFTRRGRDYHDLKREIKSLKEELDCYRKYTKENYDQFLAAFKNKNERTRILQEYKRIVYNRAKGYQKEFKFVKEYLDLQRIDEKKLENLIGEKAKNNLKNYAKIIRTDWFDMEIPEYFNLDRATKMLTRIRKNEKISPEEIETFKAEILHSGSQSNNNPNTKKDNGINIEPPIMYQDYGLDRRAVEALAYNFKDTYKTDFNLSAEEFLIVLAAAERGNVYIKDAAEKFNRVKTQGLNTDAYVKYAPEGAQILSDMLHDYMAGTKPDKKYYEDFLVFYQKSKDTIDRHSSVNPRAATGR